MNNHATSRELLLYLDGELPRERSRKIQAHLLSCWNCRREMERLERDIHAIVDAQNRRFLPSMPRPARPWDRFEELAAALPARRFHLGSWLRHAADLLSSESLSALRWATALLTILGAAATVFWLTPGQLSAETVLRRMEMAESIRRSAGASQVIRQRLRIERTNRHDWSRRSSEVESWQAGSRTIWRGDVAELKQRYLRHGLELALPLSPLSSERWLRETRAITEVHITENSVDMQASGARDDLESVMVRVQPGTWRLEAIRLTFTDAILDVAELDLTVLRKDELSTDLLAALEPTAAPLLARRSDFVPKAASGPPLSVNGPVNSADEELRVQYRLHEIGADLTDPIELKQEQEKIVIDARGVSAERKQQLTELFAGEAHVRLETEVDTKVAPAATPLLMSAERPAASKQDARLAEFFGSPEAQENFTRAVLDADASILSRLYALQNLARYWPPDVVLTEEHREQLDTMVQDHLQAFRNSLPSFKSLLDPFLAGVCDSGSAVPILGSTSSGWRESTSLRLAAARTLDRDLRGLLTSSSAGTAIASACPEMKSALQGLSGFEP